jgi:co-chaperonin GroES (HSP10)
MTQEVSMLSKLKPCGDRAVVRLDKSPRTFAGGQLEIGEVRVGGLVEEDRFYKFYVRLALVVMVGPDVTDVAVGDRVLITKFNGVPLDREFGDDLLLIKEEFVMAALGKDAHIEIRHSASEGAQGLRK